MKVTFKMLALAVAVVGIGFGVSFGAGVAYGKGKPREVQGGLTQQQLSSLLGITSAQGGQGTTGAGATQGTGQGQAGAGAGQAAGGQGAGAAANVIAQLLGTRTTVGKVVAVQANSITIETRAGQQQRVNLASNATITKLTPATLGDVREGMMIVAGGARNADGSFNASSVNPLPPELESIFGATQGSR